MSERIRMTAAERNMAHLLAAVASCDDRTAATALRFGPDHVRPLDIRERVVDAMATLGIAEVLRQGDET